MNNNNEVISKLVDAAIDGEEELKRLGKKFKDLHQELLLTYVQMRVIEAYLGHNRDRNLLRCHDYVQVGFDKIDVGPEDINFFKTLSYVKVNADNSLSIKFLEKNI